MPSNRTRRPTANDRRGAAAVEFAIAISVLLAIVFGSIELVRLSILRNSIEHASYLAARRGMVVGASRTSIEAAARDHLNLLDIGNASIVVDPATIDDTTQVIDVRVTVPVTGNSWISPVYFSGDLTGKSRILTERAATQMAAAIPPPLPSP